MKKIRLFIETKTTDRAGNELYSNERRFVQHLITLVGSHISDQVIITGTGGFTNLKNYVNELQRNTDNGGINLVIFDADFPETNGGFATRRDELLKLKADHEVEFELFLFPNNQEDGTFEHLLEQLVTVQHQGILECFERFSQCIKGRNNPNYLSPDQKAKIYTYVSTQKMTQEQEREFKKGNWYFENPDLWNFDAEALNPLKAFLKAFLQE